MIRRTDVIFVCVIVFLAVMGLLVFAISHPGFRHLVGGDFPQFPAAAKILRSGHPGHLYDFNAQREAQREILGRAEKGDLTFVYPPFVAALFAPFAQLPFLAAYSVWVCISIALYIRGVTLLSAPDARSITLALALAFGPFAYDTIIGGQLSALAFVSLAAAIWFERTGRPVLSGLAVAGCLYKPSLLIWVGPMMLVTGRWRALAGFSGGAAAAAALSLILVGVDGCRAFVDALQKWSTYLAGTGALKMRSMRYADLTAFHRLTNGGVWESVALAAVAIGLVAGMLFVWRRGVTEAVWAITLTTTLAVNVYTPIYDCLLLVIAAILVIPVRSPGIAGRSLVFALMAGGWASQWLTPFGWGQPLTIVIVAFAAYQIARVAKAGSNVPVSRELCRAQA